MAFAFISAIVLFGILGVPGYVLTGTGLYSLAHRRGVNQPWMAWIPGLNVYLAGCISDQYQAIVRGKNRNKRTALLVLILVQLAAFCAMHIWAPSGPEEIRMVPFLLIFIPAWCAGGAMIVIWFLALHDIYVSCNPKRAVLFLVLSIVFPVTQPVFLFVCRKKDLGFPL